VNNITITSTELKDIYNWMRKYRDTNVVTIKTEHTSGIGASIAASINVKINGDEVTITKSFTNVDNW
jgi:hypothetical protein